MSRLTTLLDRMLFLAAEIDINLLCDFAKDKQKRKEKTDRASYGEVNPFSLRVRLNTLPK